MIKFLFGTSIAIAIALVVVRFLADPIDSCLDSGGCYDYSAKVCRKDEPNAQQLCDQSKTNSECDEACRAKYSIQECTRHVEDIEKCGKLPGIWDEIENSKRTHFSVGHLDSVDLVSCKVPEEKYSLSMEYFVVAHRGFKYCDRIGLHDHGYSKIGYGLDRYSHCMNSLTQALQENSCCFKKKGLSLPAVRINSCAQK
jgi:hypothetical protein